MVSRHSSGRSDCWLMVMAVVVGLAVPLTPVPDADAAGNRYEVSNWTDPDGNAHRIRWNPCQTITYAVNPRLAGPHCGGPQPRPSRTSQQAFQRVSERTGIDLRLRRTHRRDPAGRGQPSRGPSRQKAAEIVVAWVDQDRAATRSPT